MDNRRIDSKLKTKLGFALRGELRDALYSSIDKTMHSTERKIADALEHSIGFSSAMALENKLRDDTLVMDNTPTDQSTD